MVSRLVAVLSLTVAVVACFAAEAAVDDGQALLQRRIDGPVPLGRHSLTAALEAMGHAMRRHFVIYGIEVADGDYPVEPAVSVDIGPADLHLCRADPARAKSDSPSAGCDSPADSKRTCDGHRNTERRQPGRFSVRVDLFDKRCEWREEALLGCEVLPSAKLASVSALHRLR